MTLAPAVRLSPGYQHPDALPDFLGGRSSPQSGRRGEIWEGIGRYEKVGIVNHCCESLRLSKQSTLLAYSELTPPDPKSCV